MELKAYEFKTNKESTVYDFCSVGPRGVVRKQVEFRAIVIQGALCYNLAFGDLNDDGRIDDQVVSNNNDAELVLLTVARIVVDFTNKRPKAVIWAEGSTPSRIRRYQMGLNKYWHDINQLFEVNGYSAWNDSESFQIGKNYVAFAARRKNRNLSFEK